MTTCLVGKRPPGARQGAVARRELVNGGDLGRDRHRNSCVRTRRASRILAACIAVLAAGMAAAEGREPSMALDAFLRLDQIPGESIDRTFRDQIHIRSIAFGMHSPVQLGGPLDLDAKASADRLVVTKWVDSASLLLAEALVTKKQLPSGRVSFRMPDGLVYLTIDLKTVFVADIESVASPDDELMSEQVTLAFADILWTYTRRKADGSISRTGFGWSFLHNSRL
jgi:type VI secretion system secreted protein Hcp